MCYHRSFIVTEEGKVLSSPTSDHHTDIRFASGIREEGFHETIPHVAIEYRPKHTLFDLRGWDIVVDQPAKPEWYGTKHKKALRDKLQQEFEERAAPKQRVYKAIAAIEIPYLEMLEPGSTIVSKDCVFLASMRDLIEVTVIANRIRIDNTRIHKINGCKFACNTFEIRDRCIAHRLLCSGQLHETSGEWEHQLRMGPSYMNRTMASQVYTIQNPPPPPLVNPSIISP